MEPLELLEHLYLQIEHRLGVVAPILEIFRRIGEDEAYRALERVGLAAFPDYMAQESDKIMQVLPTLAGPNFEAYFVYPEELRHSARIEVFRDFMVRKVLESKN